VSSELGLTGIPCQRNLIESEGPNPGRAATNIDSVKEEQRCEEEFGEDMVMIKEMLVIAMSHYEWFQNERFCSE
jgi:hypothetical protein